MNNPTLWLQLVASFLAGAALGWVYFRGLRLTIERLPASPRPATLVLLSYVGRLLIALAVFLLIARNAQWQALVAALLGFIGMRTALLRRARHEALSEQDLRKSR